MTLDKGAAALIALSRASGRPPVEEQPVDTARMAVAAGTPFLNGVPVDVASVRDIVLDVEPLLAARLYVPRERENAQALPALIFFHGGGWVVGNLDTHDQLCRKLAQTSRCAVISVDYRLAPEHRFPAALEDAERAVRWILDHAAELGIDQARTGVGGDSAGGNLAAVMALLARDGELPPLAFQLLFYPVCDLKMSHPSYISSAEGYLLTKASMAYFIESYLQHPDQADDWRASPLRASSHAGLAPAFILTAGYDPLCDEGIDYASQLAAAGGEVEHLHVPGQIHGILTASAIVTEADGLIARAGQFLRNHVSPSNNSPEAG